MPRAKLETAFIGRYTLAALDAAQTADGLRPVAAPQTIGGVPADEAREDARTARKPRASKLRAALDIPDAEEVAPETPATAPENAQDAPAAQETGKDAPDGPEAR